MAVTSSRPASAHSFSVWMSAGTHSNANPRGSTRPDASPQTMKASSGSFEWPTRIRTQGTLVPLPVVPSRFSVASTKPGAALVRGQGWQPWQGRGWTLAPRDRGREAGRYCWEGHWVGHSWGARIRTWDRGTKTRCLATWLRPITKKCGSHPAALPDGGTLLRPESVMYGEGPRKGRRGRRAQTFRRARAR